MVQRLLDLCAKWLNDYDVYEPDGLPPYGALDPEFR